MCISVRWIVNAFAFQIQADNLQKKLFFYRFQSII